MKKLSNRQKCYLDMIRYLSCFIVFLGHYFQIFINRLLNENFFNIHKSLSLLFHLPNFGVMVFFVLSGFLITYSTIFDIKKYGYFSLKKYAEKRCFRILPPLWFALIFSIVIFAIIKCFHLFGSVTYVLPGDFYSIRSKAILPIQEILHNFFLIPGKTGEFNATLWSLTYEFFYYILFAVALIFISNKQWGLGSIILLMIGAITLTLIHINEDYLNAFTREWKLFVVWLFGAFLAWIYMIDALKKLYKVIYILLFMSVLAIFINEINFFLNYPTYECYLFGILASLLICYVLTTEHNPGKTFTLISKGSQYTYTLYLIHFPLYLFILSLLGHRLLNFTVFDYILLFLFALILTNCISYYIASVIENRQLMKKLAIQIVTISWKNQPLDIQEKNI